MAAEQVLRLLDSFWFEKTILTRTHPSKLNPKLDQISNTKLEEVLPLDTKLLPIPIRDVRSKSDQTLDSPSFVFSDSPSPISVLTPTKLRTIPSGREIREFSKGTSENHEMDDIKKKQNHSHGRRRSRKGKTRRSLSLTELEFKELKGFMDLGFVFSEEDKDSKLVSLIPGLQRLGREDDDADEEQKKKIDETVISDMPYLSEAWGVLDKKMKRNPLLNWRVPIRGSEIDMKHNLKFWAHTVASIVR